ncbi:hypothetical protein FHS96_002021 [Sphingomonas zeicaulis]|uniref:hypothetical protein n=1 Tax=Sphingomonas zeicaulis TaxID=1632740 RepID=UPI003D22C801
MRGLSLFRGRRSGASALLLVACALLLRIAIPAGWMPATGVDGLVRITLCTGQGQMEAWVDGDGRIHDRKPGKSEPKTDHPCAFAGLIAPALDAAPIEPQLRFAHANDTPPAFARDIVTIGRGLAAPPPPPTGPPANL